MIIKKTICTNDVLSNNTSVKNKFHLVKYLCKRSKELQVGIESRLNYLFKYKSNIEIAIQEIYFNLYPNFTNTEINLMLNYTNQDNTQNKFLNQQDSYFAEEFSLVEEPIDDEAQEEKIDDEIVSALVTDEVLTKDEDLETNQEMETDIESSDEIENRVKYNI